MRLLILSVGALLVLAQLLLTIRALRRREPLAASRALRDHGLAVLFSPLAVLGLLVIGLHLNRLAPFEAVSQHVHDLPPPCDGLCAIGSIRFFGALVLMGLALLGVAGLLLAWNKRRKLQLESSRLPWLALGTNLIGALLALGTYLHDGQIQQIRPLFDSDKTQALLEQIHTLAEPGWSGWILASIGLVLVACLIGGGLRRLERRRGVLTLTTGLLILSLGVSAFFFTRLHAHDLKRGIAVLAGTRDDAGNWHIPERFDSSLYGSIRSSTLNMDPLPEVPGLRLPVSDRIVSFRMSVHILADLHEIQIEGRTIARLDRGRIRADENLDPLASLLKRFKDIARAESMSDTYDEGNVISLQLDERLPFGTVDAILQSAERAGYDSFRLAVLQRQNRPLSHQRISQISFSSAAVCRKGERAFTELRPPEPERLKALIEKVRGRTQKERGTISAEKFVKIPLSAVGESLRAPGGILQVEMKPWEFRLYSDPDSGSVHIPQKGGSFDFAQLNEASGILHEKTKGERVVLLVEDEVPLSGVVKALDATLRTAPDRRGARKLLFTFPCVGSIPADP